MELLQVLMDNFPDTVYFKDAKSRFVFINKAQCNVLGVKSKEEAYEKTDFDFFAPEHAKAAYKDEQRIIKTKKPLVSKIEQIRRADGQYRWVTATKEPIIDEKGDVIGIIGISRDISELKTVQEALEESEERLQQIIEFAPDGIFTIEKEEGTVTTCNPALTRITGYTKDELCGIEFVKLPFLTDSEDIKYLSQIEFSITGNVLKPFELPCKKKDGISIWLEMHVSSLKRHGSQMALLVISRDITERKLAEEALKGAYVAIEQRVNELAKLKAKIEETNKLLQQSNSDLENYTYVVSHDLKAPLRAIKAFSTFLVEDYGEKLDPNAQDYLQRIVNAVSNMDELIEDLLLLSRVGRKFMEVEEVDLNQLVNEILIDIEPTIIKRRGKVSYADLPRLRIQQVWLKQLFLNLIDNGLKFNKSETSTVEISCEEKDGVYQFQVKGNGIGIDKKYHDRLFNIFERLHTREEYEGTGIGLTTCKKIVQQFGGRIWVESEVGKGSTFVFTIPKNINLQKKEV
jgi:PAS domain S-box-containing protein